MIDRILELLTGTVEGLGVVILPLLQGIFTFGLVLCIMFLPLLLGAGLYRLLEGKTSSESNDLVMIVAGILQVLWLASCVRFMWLDITGG